ncbi:glutathione S-transferase family protein [Piscinibacter sakaiensis]|uniref:glutathione S-transferase family protein n=1 Tax=Piscinibacter sakaiensis TaxID=1547922 RepID=UPI003AAA8EBF
MIRLHYFPGNASMTPHLLLRELDVPFELVKVDRAVNAQKSPDYLKLNPNGLIPVLEDGDLVLYETPAIVLHLVDTHADAGLAPPLGTPQRAEFYKWLMWLSSSMQAMAPHYFYSDRMVAPGNAAAAAEVKAAAEAKIAFGIDQIEARLAATGGWIGGAEFSALDPYTFMLCRWTRGMQRPARTLPHIGNFLARIADRPAAQAVFEAEGLTAPYY